MVEPDRTQREPTRPAEEETPRSPAERAAPATDDTSPGRPEAGPSPGAASPIPEAAPASPSADLTEDLEDFGEDDYLPPAFTRPLPRRLNPWHLVAAGNGLVVAALVAALLWWRPWAAQTVVIQAGPSPQAEAAASPGEASAPRPSAEPADAFSLSLEERAYTAGRWTEAIAQCERLIESTGAQPGWERLADFFRLRLGQALRRLGRTDAARDALLTAAESPSPLVRGMALAELARIALADRQFLTARTLAYRAIGALGAVPGTAPVCRAADRIAAEALTRKALVFRGAEALFPATDSTLPDPFARAVDDREVRALAEAGVARFREAAAGPQVSRQPPPAPGGAWSATSAGAPLEDLLERVAGRSDLDIVWAEVPAPARRRAVFLCLRGVPEARLLEVACGAVGLLARMRGGRVEVYDPRATRSMADMQRLLAGEAVALWRRRLLDQADEDHHDIAHFGLGLLYEHEGETAGAIAEYNLLARQHKASPLAPRAMLRGAAIRIDLRDYTGARQQLLDLLNRYPEFPEADKVYLRLGEATLEAGLFHQAIPTFRKLYYWELSRPSQIGAAFGAGKAYWRLGQFGEAVKWFERFRQAAGDKPHPARAEAEYLLARSLLALGRPEEAEAALRRSLAAGPTHPLRADVLLTLADCLARHEAYPEALALVRCVRSEAAPPVRRDAAVLREARILRAMGLTTLALRTLKEHRDGAATLATAAEMEVALARCLLEMDRGEEARRLLESVLAHLEPGTTSLEGGRLDLEAALLLAKVHLNAGRAHEAVTLLRNVVQQSQAKTDGTLRHQAFRLLGRAYLANKDYERAALALAGKVPPGGGEGGRP